MPSASLSLANSSLVLSRLNLGFGPHAFCCLLLGICSGCSQTYPTQLPLLPSVYFVQGFIISQEESLNCIPYYRSGAPPALSPFQSCLIFFFFLNTGFCISVKLHNRANTYTVPGKMSIATQGNDLCLKPSAGRTGSENSVPSSEL